MESWPRRDGFCNCMAQEHALFANCLTCGRILCALDKGDVCTFCGDDLMKTPDIDKLVIKISAATDGKEKCLFGLEEAQRKVDRLVTADSQEAGTGVLEEAPDQTTAAFRHPSYTAWETIQEAKDRYVRSREAAEDEKMSRRKTQLSSLLGLG